MSRVDDMTRLHDQVIAGHRGRKSFISNLVKNGDARSAAVGVARAAIVAANNERKRNLKGNLSAFMANLAAKENSRQQEAARLRVTLAAVVDAVAKDVASLSRDVAATRKANRAMNAATHAENAAAREAWRGVAMSSSGRRGAKSGSHAA